MAVKKLVKGIIIALVILAVLAGVLVGLRFFFNRNTEEVVTYRVKKETYENVIEISGTVAAAQQQTLQALSAGTVMGVYVKAGDHVKKGDVIMKLDDTTEQYNLAKHDYEMDKTRITGSAKDLKLMQTQRLSLLQKIADRKVVATFDGIIADLDVAVGDSLEAKDKVGTIVNTDYLTADVEVTETDVAKLKVGQDVDFTFAAYDQAVVHGYVVSWPAIGEITSRGATIVKVRVRIDEYPAEILPNFSFTGKIQLSPTEEYLVVERYAIGYEDKQPYVVIAKTGEKKSVKIQPYGREYVKVLEGLEGNEVLLQQTKPIASGSNRNRGGQSGNRQRQGNSGGGMPPMGGIPMR